MAIRIIRPGREFPVSIGDATFTVRRMTDAEYAAFDAAHPVGSAPRVQAYLTAVIVGWTGVLTEDGQPAAFAAELVPLLSYEDVIEPILARLRGGLDPLAARAASATSRPSPGTPNG